jgi:ubiquinone/menaquinone biosynthesis C-methylase UbiE
LNRLFPTARLFDRIADMYDLPLIQRLAYRPIHDALLSALGTRHVTRVLDLGCGTGQLAARLCTALPATEVVGCDYSEPMLRRAAGRRDRSRWVRADAAHLPFPDESVDAVVSTEAFHWFPDQAAALSECFRVLRPGGQLLVAFVNTPFSPVGHVAHLGSSLMGEPFYWPTTGEMRGLVETAGFRVGSQRRITRLNSFFLPPVLTAAIRPAN